MSTRREFLTGQPLREALDSAAAEISGEADAPPACVPLAGNTVRLGKVAMASDFEVIQNAGPGSRLDAASQALDLIDRLEDQLSVYRPHSELSRLNARAAREPVQVETRLYDLLRQALSLADATDGAFDPTAGPLVALWRQCRRERRVPQESEVAAARARLGREAIACDDARRSIRFLRPGIELNLNALGKGYALDRAAELLEGSVPWPPAGGEESNAERPTSNVEHRSDFLLHGGYSSILARGSQAGHDGWPIAIRHPLFPSRTLATLWLKDRGLSTSGSAVQFYRVGGQRYGHLLDPRTGWPAEGMLAVVVLAPTAALAEALSTAFFVLGVEKGREYCHNYPDIAALLIPAPAGGSRLEPVNVGIPEGDLELSPDG